ncbi:hypothetical protein EH223_10105 [candidate division KSB1 bacterium]|nr:hypothetical protein [candidate division KSB1 bacterium]RQW03399.1 MAG: hypothetical protein EH223_10105 [candidate division KSB1 bacterium]
MDKMTKILNMLLPSLVILTNAFPAVTIESIKGEVKVRHGLDEHWTDAQKGMLLEEIDTIQTWEGTVVLRKQDGSTFTMGSLSILDISELRNITRHEMFLFLMSQKVQRLEPRQQPARLNPPNVSSVHGEKKSAMAREPKNEDIQGWVRELNAAKAMVEQAFYTNSVVKLHKVLSRYSEISDCGEVNLYLGKSFEELDEPGQAIDNYQIAAEKAYACGQAGEAIADAAQKAVRQLSR